MTPDVAIVLAGGAGTRLREAVPGVPKVIAPVAGRPFLDHLFRYFEREGISRLIVASGIDADRVESVAAAHQGRLVVQYSREPRPLGTGGAISRAFRMIREDHAWVFNGDSFCGAGLSAVTAAARIHPEDAWLVAVEVDDASRFGTITFQGSRVLAFEEKSGHAVSGWINAGIYLMPRALLDDTPTTEAFSIEKELFPKWAAAGRLHAIPVRAPFLDIGTPESYAAASRFLGSFSPA